MFVLLATSAIPTELADIGRRVGGPMLFLGSRWYQPCLEEGASFDWRQESTWFGCAHDGRHGNGIRIA